MWFLFLQIPFYPVVKKDLTFIHLGNDSKIEGLINFEKLRMIAKEVRTLTNMCSSPYDLLTMLGLGKRHIFLFHCVVSQLQQIELCQLFIVCMTGGQPPSNAMVALNQLTMASGAGGPQGAATVKRRKKSTAQPNPKKMFEEVM